MTSDKYTTLLALRDKATPLPWKSLWEDGKDIPKEVEDYVIIDRKEVTGDFWEDFVVGLMWHDGVYVGITRENAEYIVAAANNLPSLIEENQQLRRKHAVADYQWSLADKKAADFETTVNTLTKMLDRANDKIKYLEGTIRDHLGPTVVTGPMGPAVGDSCLKIVSKNEILGHEILHGECDGSCDDEKPRD